MKLLTPLVAGDLQLKNRIVMAPLTRCRASGSDGRTPNEIMKEYYTQRASAGMIITEATSISPMGVGYPNTPGIWSDDHIQGWKQITEAVHKNSGLIVLQLWHVGRVSDPIYLNGALPVAPSAIAPKGFINLVRPQKEFVTPKELSLSEIKEIVGQYKKAAENAKLAGFDGVEIHGANGYLLDQFLQDSSNKRNDEYGGTIENRARLMLEVTDACISVWGAGRVGMHLAPRCDAHSMGDSDPESTFMFVARELGKRNIAFICARESLDEPRLGNKLKSAFGGTYIINERLTPESAENAVSKSQADAAAFGVLYISNPDLVKRIETKSPLNTPNKETFYFGGTLGYTDYPAL